MELPPLIERELRVALRKQSPRKVRFWVTLGAVMGASIVMLVAALTQSAEAGRMLFQVLLVGALAGMLGVPRVMAGAFAAERENQTLGLLMLSGLHPLEVFLSKVVSAALVSTTLLLALTPFLAVPFLAGGISFDQFVATLIALPNLLLFAIAVSLLASVACADTGTAQFAAKVSLAALCLLPLAVYCLQKTFAGAAPLSSWWLWASPAFVPWSLFTSATKSPGLFAGFWVSSSVTLGWSCASLLAAGWTLRRVWRAEEGPAQRTSWRLSRRNAVQGTTASRRWQAQRCLAVNPFLWLATRNRGPVVWAWLALGSLGIGWLTGLLLWPARSLLVANLLLTSFLLNLALGTFISQAAASTLARLRRTGEMEQLLCTPLDPGAMIWGQLEALRRQFNPLWWTVLAGHVALLMAGIFLLPGKLWAGLVYVLCFGFMLVWHGSLLGEGYQRLLVLWLALYTGRARWAVWKSNPFGRSGWTWFFLLVCSPVAIRSWRSFPTGADGEFYMLGAVAAFGVAYWLEARQRARALANRLILAFREVAQEPIPAEDDPRLKRWQLDRRLPLDDARLQAELVERVVRRQGRRTRV
jgi:ABC-type transport system involved in cytochrome c biogenesis permease component